MNKTNPSQNINLYIESIFKQLNNIRAIIDNYDRKIDNLQNSTNLLNTNMDSVKCNFRDFCLNQENTINTKLNDILREIRSHTQTLCNFIILFIILLQQIMRH